MNNTNLIRHLRPQIREILSDLMDWFGYTHTELMVALKQEKWYETQQFCRVEMNFNGVMMLIRNYIAIREWDTDSNQLANELNAEFTIEAVGIAADRTKETDKPAKGDLAA